MIKRILKRILKPKRKTILRKGLLKYSVDAQISRANIEAQEGAFIDAHVKISGNLSIGRGSTIGRLGIIYGDVSIGNFCQFAPNVGLYSRNHPVNYLSMYTNSYLFDGRLKQRNMNKKIEIGHGVWLGHGALILSSVKIGNGAIVAGGSVVTKPVPPYAIVAGNPAKIIRYRFNEETIQEIEQLDWYNKPMEELKSIEQLFHIDLAENPEALDHV